MFKTHNISKFLFLHGCEEHLERAADHSQGM